METTRRFMNSPVRYWMIVLMPALLLSVPLYYVNNIYGQEKSQQFFQDYMCCYLMLYIPTAGIIRSKAIGLSFKEMLLSMTPFGRKYRNKRLFYSKMDKES